MTFTITDQFFLALWIYDAGMICLLLGLGLHWILRRVFTPDDK